MEIAREKGSIVGTIVNLVSTIVGAGCLTLPFVASRVGLLSCLLLLFVMACLSGYSFFILTSSFEATGTRSYKELAAGFALKFSLLPNLSIIAEATVALYVFGTSDSTGKSFHHSVCLFLQAYCLHRYHWRLHGAVS